MAGGIQSDSDQPLSDINVTPLVDVMLVLLVIFILLAPMFAQALKVDLPNVAAPPSQEPIVVDVAMEVSGRLSMDGEHTSISSMIESLQLRIGDEPTLVVRLHADQVIPYGEVAAVMTALRGAGVQRLAFAMGGTTP